MNEPREVWQFDRRALGRRVLVYDRVESTNSLAAELAAKPEREQLAILTAEQTAGRGQHGRTWTAAPGSSVLLSLLLFPPDFLRRPPVLTAWAAVSVCETIRQLTGEQATIKWPNDVVVQGKKVCGILIEQGRGTVVGIGLNVRQTEEDFLAARLVATSLREIGAELVETEQVAQTLLDVLDEEYARLNRGDLTSLEVAWQGHLDLLGRVVVAECAGAVHRGRLRTLTFDALELEEKGDATLFQMEKELRPLFLRPEQVQHLSAVG